MMESQVANARAAETAVGAGLLALELDLARCHDSSVPDRPLSPLQIRNP